MSIMDQIQKPDDRAVAVTVLGDAGTGKTSLAATFPSPVFIRAEDGMQAIPHDQRPDALPIVNSVDDLWAQLHGLVSEEHSYRTVVIDSVTALERMFSQHIVDSDPKKPKSINQAMGGYGAGLMAVGSLHQRVRKAAGLLIQRGINVVFIAHADTETIELPDQDPYTRYSLRLHRRSVAPYTDDVDAVGFIKLQTFTHGDGERKKAVSTGERVLVCYATASCISKNRFGIADDLPVPYGVNPLVDFIPYLRGANEGLQQMQGESSS